MTFRRTLRLVVMAVVLTGAAGADAMPVARAGLVSDQVGLQRAQYRYGHGSRVQYRRALRRYRGNPGARFELRQNRRIYCRNTPERC
jgi:hypothetical protein